MSDTTVQLGDVTFSGLEIPAEIPWGGTQRLAVHELVGGARVIDAMGRSDRPLEWSGIFQGLTASARAQLLDSIRVGGKPQQLLWAQFSYLVVVREFEARYQRFYQIPYHIVCEVVTDQTSPVTSAKTTDVDSAIQADLASAQDLANAIAHQELVAVLTALETAIGLVETLAQAPPSAINAVLAAVIAAQTQTVADIGSATLAIGTGVAFGGVAISAPPSANAAALTAQTANVIELSNLILLRNVLGRMAGNLVSIYSSPNTIAVAGGTLFALAENAYDDATAWTAIAKANNLTDPFVQGAGLLTIPLQSDGSGGVLSP